MNETFTKHEAQEKVRQLPTICESHGKQAKAPTPTRKKDSWSEYADSAWVAEFLLTTKRTAASAESILVHRSMEEDDFPPGSDFTRADSPIARQ